MNRHLAQLALLSAVGTTLVIPGGCSDSKTTVPAPPTIVKGITVSQVAAATLPHTIELSGTVRARTSALVSARIPGTVSVLHVREGDRVRKGQLVAHLESQEHAAQANAAGAAIDEARRGLDEALAQRKLADATFARFKTLYDEQALTRQEFETHQTQRELAQQGVARAEARLRQAQQTARAAGAMADYAKIIAPITGIITSKQVNLGATVFPGQPLMTIEDEGSYQLELAVPESYANAVRPGMPIQITLDSLQKTIATTVAELVPAADPGSRTFIVKVNLPSTGLKSGMFGRGIVTLKTTRSVLMVPQQAVFERGALTAVWTVDHTNTIRMRLVKTGRSEGRQVEVLAGLSSGERIVANSSPQLIDGAKLAP
jgi:RND family efflux transporter MFP subunit